MAPYTLWAATGQNRPLALQKKLGVRARHCSPDCDRLSIQQWEIADATVGVHRRARWPLAAHAEQAGKVLLAPDKRVF
jgi:hypothetical protein